LPKVFPDCDILRIVGAQLAVPINLYKMTLLLATAINR
jgi:hypothetical protein